MTGATLLLVASATGPEHPALLNLGIDLRAAFAARPTTPFALVIVDGDGAAQWFSATAEEAQAAARQVLEGRDIDLTIGVDSDAAH